MDGWIAAAGLALSTGVLAAPATTAMPAALDPESPWILTATDPFGAQYHPTFTANGYFGARIPAQGQGVATQAGPGNPKPIGTSFEINGFYTGRLVTDVARDSETGVSKEWRVSGPGWTGLDVSDGSGSFSDAFTPGSDAAAACTAGRDCAISNYVQSLDLRTGAITTSATWTSPAGRVTDVAYTVLTDRANDQRALVTARITPRWSGRLTVTDVLDARPTDHVEAFEQHRDPAEHRIGLTTRLRHTGVSATHVSILAGDGTLGEAAEVPADSIGQTLTADVVDGATHAFVKYVALTTSDDRDNGYAAASAIADAARAQGHEAIRRANDAAWAKIWEGDIQVRGNDDLQAQIRASRFYLMASVGTRAWSPSPAGLSSANYGGHVFWDTETWMWPAIVAQNPDIAAAILDYRHARLDQARYNAKNTIERSPDARGSNDLPDMNHFVRAVYEGARFPWESGYHGTESTESYFFGGHEIHISADVALAFWQYYLVTGDKAWLARKGWPVISGTADFWVSRSVAGEDGRFHIRDVTPPDEWASNGNVGWDDSAYTNTAASRNLEIAIDTARILGKQASPGWAQRVGRFHIPFDASKGITLEYTGYDGRIIKQGDVVMLSYPWENGQSQAVTAADLDYYAKRVDEYGSPSMTDAIHAIVAADLGRADEAYWFTGRSSGGFLRGDFKQFTEERAGGHAFTFITGAGGFLQQFLYGYSGLRWGVDAITLDPILPRALEEIRLTGLQYQGSTFEVTIGRDTTQVAVTAGRPLRLADGRTVQPGTPVNLPTRQCGAGGSRVSRPAASTGGSGCRPDVRPRRSAGRD